MIYLLDTNVILHVVNSSQGHERIREQLKLLSRPEIGLSAITAMELWHKALNKKVSLRATTETLAMLNAYRILPFKGDAARIGGQLLLTAREKGKPIGWPDTMLAAHALALGATVATDNTKDFMASGCKLVNWRKPS